MYSNLIPSIWLLRICYDFSRFGTLANIARTASGNMTDFSGFRSWSNLGCFVLFRSAHGTCFGTFVTVLLTYLLIYLLT